MPEGSGAGASAAEQARRMREQAARLEEQADHWEAGAQGERLTGDLLEPLKSAGFVVLHDLAVAGSKANVDHVVVTSWGVAVIDSKNYSTAVKHNNEMLWRGRYPMRRELDTLIWETGQVRAAITGALPQWQLTYRSVLCMHGPHLLPPGLRVGTVEVISPQDLVGALTTGPALLSPAHVTALGSILRSHLEPRADPLALPAPVRPSRQWSPPRGERPGTPRLPRPDPVGPTRPVRPAARPRPAAALSSAGKQALAILGLLGLFAAAGGALMVSGRRLVSLPAIHVPTTPPTTAAASPTLTFECPVAGKGWSLRLLWQSTDVPTVTWDVSTAPSPAGPWTIRYVGDAQPSAPIVSGLGPRTRLVVRAGGIMSAAPSQDVIAPATAC